jgi:hypothetical protein
MSKLTSILLLCLCAAAVSVERAAYGVAPQAFADAHIHFNWDQKEVIDAGSVVDKLRRSGVAFAVVSGTPSQLALELHAAGGDLIVPIFSPYTHELGRRDWFLHERTLRLAEEGLGSGAYRGIGEVHFMQGFRPRNDNEVFHGLLDLAERYRVPVMVHVDAADAGPFIEICERRPAVKLSFAHAGGILDATQIRRIIAACDNTMIEFSARDPWRFGGLTSDDGRLLPAWRELVLEYPERFMTGTDPVWKVTRTQTWDQADDGWDYFEQLIDYHRAWLDDLPSEVRRLISVDNASRFFGVDGASADSQ